MGLHILLLNWQDIKHPLGGGAEVHLQEIFKRIITQGHSVTQLSSAYAGLKSEETIDGIQIIRRGSRNLFNYAAVKVCRRIIKNEQIDIVIDCLNKIPLLSPLYVKNIPTLGIVHHLFKKSIFHEASLPMALYVYAFEKFIRPVYKHIPFCVISESTKQDLSECGIPKSQITIIDICVDHDLYRYAPETYAGEPLIGYLGRIKKYKSVDHLLKAFSHVLNGLPDARLVIVGDGDNVPDLKKLAHDLGLSGSVEFTGFVSEQKKVEILQQCTVVVNPSIKEGWGLTVIEANACGTPTIAANVPGLRDSVIDGKTGFLYQYGNTDLCAQLIKDVVNNKKLREQLSANALEWAARFNWDTSAEKTLNLINHTIESYKKSKK